MYNIVVKDTNEVLATFKDYRLAIECAKYMWEINEHLDTENDILQIWFENMYICGDSYGTLQNYIERYIVLMPQNEGHELYAYFTDVHEARTGATVACKVYKTPSVVLEGQTLDTMYLYNRILQDVQKCI